jgi:hypothetical protein
MAVLGCAGPDRYSVVRPRPTPSAGGVVCAPNLALGPSAEHGRLAELFNARLARPSVAVGYRLGDVSYYSELIYDDQTFYDRYGGGFYREAETFRTGVRLR